MSNPNDGSFKPSLKYLQRIQTSWNRYYHQTTVVNGISRACIVDCPIQAPVQLELDWENFTRALLHAT